MKNLNQKILVLLSTALSLSSFALTASANNNNRGSWKENERSYETRHQVDYVGTIDRSGNYTRSSDQNGKTPQWSAKLTTEYRRVESWNEIYEYKLCTKTEGNGRQGVLSIFPSATDLAKIRGIGDATADFLIAEGYFSSRPSSWESFKSEIRSAAKKLKSYKDNPKSQKGKKYKDINADFDDEVIEKYGSSNIEALDFQKKTVCSEQQETSPHESVTVLNTISRKVTLKIYGGNLHPAEIENFTIKMTADGEYRAKLDLEMSSNAKNKRGVYNNCWVKAETSNEYFIDVQCERVKAPATNFLTVHGQDTSSTGDEVVLNVNDDSFDSSNNGKANLLWVAMYEGRSCSGNPFIQFNSSQYKPFSLRTSDGYTEIKTGVRRGEHFGAKRKVICVRYWFMRLNDADYASEWSDSKDLQVWFK